MTALHNLRWERVGRGLLWGVLLPLLLVSALLVDAYLDGLPAQLYLVRQPSPEEECKKVRPGMELSEVLTIFSERLEPQWQTFSKDRVVFQRYWNQDPPLVATTCTVELDATTERVVSSRFEGHER